MPQMCPSCRRPVVEAREQQSNPDLFCDAVPCGTCTMPTHMIGTRRCDNCYEVESRLVTYLRAPNGRAFIRAALATGPAHPPLLLRGHTITCDSWNPDAPCTCK
jgi:hypothetical protein